MNFRFFRGIKSNRWAITKKMFFSLFLTGTIIEFSEVGAGFIDGLITSRYLGADEMAAVGIAYPIYTILGIFSGLLATAMEVRCSQAIGRGKRDELSQFFSLSVYAGVLLSCLFTLPILLFSRPFATLLGASGNASDLVEPTAQYLLGVGIGIPPLILTAILAPAFQLDNAHRNIQISALLRTAINILMDFLAVRMDLGIFGIGLATAISSYICLLYQCTHFFRKERMLHLVRPSIPVMDYIRTLPNGMEKAVKRLANTIRPIILNNIIIAYGGTAAMSALSVRNNFSGFAEIFGVGIASSISLLTGLYYGEINKEAISEVNDVSNKLTFFISGLSCLLMLVFSRGIAGFYVTENGEVLNMAAFAITMLALQNPLQAIIASRIKYLQAIHRKLNMNLLIFATKLFFVLAVSFVLGRLFGVYGILASYTASDALTLLSILVFYQIRERRFLITKDDLLNLPEEFDIEPENVISLDVRDMDDVSVCSEQIMLFCKGHKIDRKIAYYAALCFEEIATNTIQYGFPENHSSIRMIDLRVVISGDTLVIRMSDDCPRYDLTRVFAAANAPDADKSKNIGARIVSNVATEIDYLNTFNTNIIILRFNTASEINVGLSR